MKTLLLVLWVLCSAVAAYAQQQPQALPTDANQVQTLLERTGCQAQISAASNTIAQQQRHINDLQKQLDAKDPPKSGATRH
jgi:hypothetical protein